MAWSPSSQFLAVGSYDEKVRLHCVVLLTDHVCQIRVLNNVTWKKICELGHSTPIESSAVVCRLF